MKSGSFLKGVNNWTKEWKGEVTFENSMLKRPVKHVIWKDLAKCIRGNWGKNKGLIELKNIEKWRYLQIISVAWAK